MTIDGSLSGGADRSLSITNTAGDGSRSIVILIKSGGIGNGADNNTVKNTILSGSRGAGANLGTAGIVSFTDPEPNNYGGALSQPLSVTTNTSGAYQFPAVQTGQTYLVTVAASGYTFASPTQVIYLTGNITDANFVAN